MREYICFILGILLFPILTHAKVAVIIDPGHDGEDIATGNRTAAEVNTNWEVANKLKTLILNDMQLGWDAMLTRTENDNDGRITDLYHRTFVGNAYQDANPGVEVYFLSIHCNGKPASVKERAYGTVTLYCNHTYSSNDQLLQRYARNINKDIVEIGEMHDKKNCGEDLPFEGFHLGVLDGLYIPNCLSEIGFVDDYDDQLKLLDDNYRNKYAFAYFEAIKATHSDLEVLSYNFDNLPCFSNNQYFTKVTVTLKNVSKNNFSGDVKTILRYLPYRKIDPINQDFCQLGNYQSVSLASGQQISLSFSANIYSTLEVGMALCFESRRGTISTWEYLPAPNYKRIIKVPMNAAKVQGTIYTSSYIPLAGADIWSYQLPTLKSTYVNSDFFDPTSSLSDEDGKYDILVPSDWNEAIISVRNYSNYDEIKLSPIANSTLSHYFKSSPIVIGVGSGSGSCGNIKGQSPNDPQILWGQLDSFDQFGINGQPEISFAKPNEQLRFCVFPKPKNRSGFQLYSCGGSLHKLLIYTSITECYIQEYPITNGKAPFSYKYFITLSEIDSQNNTIGIPRILEVNETRSDQLFVEGIDINKALTSNGIILALGKRYKLKLKYFSFGQLGDEYDEKETILNVYSGDLILEDPNIKGNIYTSDNIILKNANINSQLELKATNSIKIQPQTLIKGSFHALINSGLKNGSLIASNNSTASPDAINADNVQLPYLEIENRFVSKHSDNCLCENKVVEEFDECEDTIAIFPNPATDKLLIRFSSNSSGTIELFDMNGRKVKEENFSGTINKLTINDLATGEYLVNINSNLGKYSGKFIKK